MSYYKDFADWFQIRDWMVDPKYLQDPMICIRVMQRGGFIEDRNKLCFAYGSLYLKRHMSMTCFDQLEINNYLRSKNGWLEKSNIDTLNRELFDFEPLFYKE